MQDANYHREYRTRSTNLIHAKLDRILELLGDSKKPEKVKLKPYVKLPSMNIGKAVAAGVCLHCGAPPNYMDKNGLYCALHSTRDSKPI